MNSAMGPNIYLETWVFTSLIGLWTMPWNLIKSTKHNFIATQTAYTQTKNNNNYGDNDIASSIPT